MKLTPVLLSLALCFSAPRAFGQPATDYTDTGNGLLTTCTTTQLFEASLCAGFISGSTGQILLQQIIAKNKTVCFPDGVTRQQEKDVVVAYLQANPQNRQLPSPILVYNAFVKAWPCGTS